MPPGTETNPLGRVIFTALVTLNVACGVRPGVLGSPIRNIVVSWLRRMCFA